MVDSETLFCDNSQDGILYLGPGTQADTATQAAPVTTTPSSITVQWKHYLRQLYLELSRYPELDI